VISASSASRGAPRDAFADAVDYAGGKNQRHRLRQRKTRLGQRRQRIAQHHQRFAPAEKIAQGAGKNFHHRRRRFGEPFQQTETGRARAQHAGHIQRQQRVDEFG